MLGANFLKTSSLLFKQTLKFGQAYKMLACFSEIKLFQEQKENTLPKYSFKQSIYSQQKSNQIDKTNASINAFISRVYKTTGLGILGVLAASQVAIGMGLPLFHPLECMFGGFFITMIGKKGFYCTQPKYISEFINGREILKTKNSPIRLGFYFTFIAGLGLICSPLFDMAQSSNPMILPISIGITSLIFGSACLYAYMQPKDSLLPQQNTLQSGLLILIGLQLSGLLTSLIIGPNIFSHCIHNVDTFFGVGLFSAIIASDTHKAIAQYKQGQFDHLQVSIDFILSYINILIRVVGKQK